MKHIALFLAVVIFALSLVSCGNLNYFIGSDWEYTAEEFFGEPFENINNKIAAIRAEYGISGHHSLYNFSDRNIWVLMYDDNASFIFKFDCEDLWCVYEAEMFFFGENENDLNDYEKQRKYVDFMNEVTHTLVYDSDPDSNVFKEAYDYCIANEVSSYDSEKHFDAMLGDLIYGVLLNTENYGQRYKLSGSSEIEKACNYYHFRGLVRGDFEDYIA